MVEALEHRRLLANSLLNGVLSINGTSGRDNIHIVMPGQARTALVVHVNGQQETFAVADVTSIMAEGGGGHDSIDLSGWPKPCTVLGGNGNDNLRGGDAAGLLVGGRDNDVILGGSGGGSTLSGGRGNDELTAPTGFYVVDTDGTTPSYTFTPDNPATLIGGAGNDTLNGGGGNDYLTGDEGDDVLNGGARDDRIIGGAGNDTITDHEGRNVFRGGDGDDTLSGSNSRDKYHGGPGEDVLNEATSSAMPV